MVIDLSRCKEQPQKDIFISLYLINGSTKSDKRNCSIALPLFKPGLIWELKEEVNNVCFPIATALC